MSMGLQDAEAVVVRKAEHLNQIARADDRGNEHEDGPLGNIGAGEIARELLDYREHLGPAEGKLPPAREKSFVVRTHLPVLVDAFGGFALSVRQHVGFDPLEGVRVGGGLELVPLLEVDDEAVQIRASQCVNAVEVWEDDFLGFGVSAYDFVSLR